MTIIGSFIAQDDGGYRGQLHTLGLRLKDVRIRPVPRKGERAPDFRVFVQDREIGAAWRHAPEGKPAHLCLRLDDPSFPAPLQARLIESDGEHRLYWSRRPT